MAKFIRTLTVATAGLALNFMVLGTKQAQAADFKVTIEQPGIQQSNLYTNPGAYGAQNVKEETFNSLSQGAQSSVSLPSGIGTFDKAIILGTDIYGGADGAGNYVSPRGLQSSTLTLSSPQRYFGMWWSAGDASNKLDFYSGNTLLKSFTTADVINFINTQPNAGAYYGNPNFGQGNGSEPYAFLNYFADPNDESVTFDKIVFSSFTFESDNYTVASSYRNTSGQPIEEPKPTPEPGTMGGIALIAGTALMLKKKSASQQKLN